MCGILVPLRAMFVRVKSTPNSPRKSVQICESQRTGEKVRQTIVRFVGIAVDEQELAALIDLAEVIRIKLEAERSSSLPLFAPEDLASARSKTVKRLGPKKEKRPPLSVEEVRLANLEEEARFIEGIGGLLAPSIKSWDSIGFSLIRANKTSSWARDTSPSRTLIPIVAP